MNNFNHVECGRLRAVLCGYEDSAKEIEEALWYTGESLVEDAYNDDLDQSLVFAREVHFNNALRAWEEDASLTDVVENLQRYWSI